MEQLVKLLFPFYVCIIGIKDALFSPFSSLWQIGLHRELHQLGQCFLLNGIVFWCSYYLIQYIILPLAEHSVDSVLAESSLIRDAVRTSLVFVVSKMFDIFWLIPLLLLTKCVNIFWFQDIANTAFRHLKGKPRTMPKFVQLVADLLFSMVIEVLFLVLVIVVNYLPFPIGFLASYFLNCILFSLYMFEYKWYNMGWDLDTRLAAIECNLPYYAGFGLPLTVLASLSSKYYINVCVFAVLFPLFIISCNKAQPYPQDGMFSIPVFTPVVFISNFICRNIPFLKIIVR